MVYGQIAANILKFALCVWSQLDLIPGATTEMLAEDEGFEPSVGCPTHAFQACALGRYANPPVLLTRLKGIGGDD